MAGFMKFSLKDTEITWVVKTCHQIILKYSEKNTFLYISHVFFILNHAKCLLLANSIEHSLLIGLSTVHELLPVASGFHSDFLFPTVPSLSKSALFAGPVLTQWGLMCWCHLLWHLLLSSMLWLISNNQRSCAYFNRRACLGSKIQLRA